jgi:hypothetical protein
MWVICQKVIQDGGGRYNEYLILRPYIGLFDSKESAEACIAEQEWNLNRDLVAVEVILRIR